MLCIFCLRDLKKKLVIVLVDNVIVENEEYFFD